MHVKMTCEWNPLLSLLLVSNYSAKDKKPQSCNSLLEQLQPILTDCQGQAPTPRDTSLKNLCMSVCLCMWIYKKPQL